MSVQIDRKDQPPTAQEAPRGAKMRKGGNMDNDDWLSLAEAAFNGSTTYVDSNYRQQWEDGLRMFYNQHPADSKYNSPSYAKRSRLFRPKTRSVIRKNEAAAQAAFFSNMDVVTVQPSDQDNKMQVASGEVMKQLMQYRLTHSIPWFQILLGGLQDAQNVGVAVAHVYWEYEGPAEEEQADVAITDKVVSMSAKRKKLKPKKDKPTIDLIPVENIRIDPAASWTDPVNTSPYIIHLIPMYAQDVKERMLKGEWKTYSDSYIQEAVDPNADTTRLSRNGRRQDPTSTGDRSVDDYNVVWVHRHIHRRAGIDWEFYTLASYAMLSDPVPLEEVVFLGCRPYVMGCCILETHKIYPSGFPQMGKELQLEANEIANQRIDNVKFVLNKKWFAKRGRDVDVGGLVRNVPGGVVMMTDPINDIREVTWPDVTSSAYEEQSRIDADLNELLGNFSPITMLADKQLNAPARNFSLLSQSTGALVEYTLATFKTTFVEPLLSMLVKLEQAYETDTVLLALVAQKAKIWQRYGISAVTDQMLDEEMTLTVNVGMGATDPGMRLQKFVAATTSFVNIMKEAPPGTINLTEVGKEIYGNLGYNDGTRFLSNDDPQVVLLSHQLQQAQQMIQQLQAKLKDKGLGHLTDLTKTRESNQTRIATTLIREKNENRRALAVHSRAITEADANLRGRIFEKMADMKQKDKENGRN